MDGFIEEERKEKVRQPKVIDPNDQRAFGWQFLFKEFPRLSQVVPRGQKRVAKLINRKLNVTDTRRAASDLMQGQTHRVKTVLERCAARNKTLIAFKDSPGNSSDRSPI